MLPSVNYFTIDQLKSDMKVLVFLHIGAEGRLVLHSLVIPETQLEINLAAIREYGCYGLK